MSEHAPASQRETFEDWMTCHQGIIVKIARSFTSDAHDYEDLSQDIALSLWRSIPSFGGRSKASTWIWRVSLNQAISWRRSETSPNRSPHVVPATTVPDTTEEAVLVDRIYQAIRTLAPVDRSLIMLSLEGFSYATISDVTGLTETNVGARLSRARSQLTDLLEDSK